MTLMVNSATRNRLPRTAVKRLNLENEKNVSSRQFSSITSAQAVLSSTLLGLFLPQCCLRCILFPPSSVQQGPDLEFYMVLSLCCKDVKHKLVSDYYVHMYQMQF